MAKFELKQEIPGRSVSECYQACISSLDQIGYALFKKRDLANLLICNETLDGRKINLSLMVPFGSPTSIQANLSSDSMDDEALQIEADRILKTIVSNLTE